MEILRVENLSRVFGGIVAVADASLSIHEGQFVGIIGPNGAGKTTLFNCITGMYGLSNGNVSLKVEDKFVSIGNLSPSKNCTVWNCTNLSEYSVISRNDGFR